MDTESVMARHIAALNGDMTIRGTLDCPAQPPAGPSGPVSVTPIADSLEWLMTSDSGQ